MITLSAATDGELYNRLDAERFRTAQGVVGVYLLFVSSLCLLLFTAGAALQRLATRLMVAKPSAGEWGSPAESTTLLLRSFGDDKLRINTLPSGRRGLISAWSFRASDRFEEVVAWELSDIGTLEAVGEPGSRLRSLGAARTLLDPHHWTTAVRRRMQDVANIVAVMGDTPGFSWEVRALAGAGALDKTIFVMPPVARKTAALRRQSLRMTLEVARSGAASSRPTTISDAIVFRVRDAGLWTAAVNRRDEAGYRAAIRAAIESQALSGLPPPPPDAVPALGPAVSSLPDL